MSCSWCRVWCWGLTERPAEISKVGPLLLGLWLLLLLLLLRPEILLSLLLLWWLSLLLLLGWWSLLLLALGRGDWPSRPSLLELTHDLIAFAAQNTTHEGQDFT